MSGDIAFRRIHGRIVPIRLNKSQRETGKGLAISAAGAGVALGGASIYKRAVMASANLAKKGFDLITPTKSVFGGGNKKFRSAAQMSFDDVLKAGNGANSEKAFRAAKNLSSFSGLVRKGAPVLGGALFAYGATKIVNANKKKKLHPETAAVIGAIGAGGIKPAYKAAQKVFEFGLNNRQTKMKFAGSFAKETFKKYAAKVLK